MTTNSRQQLRGLSAPEERNPWKVDGPLGSESEGLSLRRTSVNFPQNKARRHNDAFCDEADPACEQRQK